MATMPIVPRYFLRQFLPVFLLCLAVLASVLLMNHFLKLFGLAVAKGISFAWILGCFARLLPFVLSLALPMAFLVALLLSLGQLAETGEALALRASGFSFMEMTWPFLAVAALLSGSLLYLNHKASPEGFHAFRERVLGAGQRIARVELEPGSFLKLGPWKLYAKEVDKRSGRLEGVYLVRVEGSGVRVSARSGRLELDPGRGAALLLEDGELQLPNPDPGKFTSGRFERYRLELPLSGGPRSARRRDIQEMSTPTLERLIRDPATSVQHRVEYKVESSLRSAAALSPFVFFWIGAPLALGFSRQSRAMAFALALAILFGYYGMIALGIAAGRRHEPLSRYAPWAADAAGLVAGALLTRRAARR